MGRQKARRKEKEKARRKEKVRVPRKGSSPKVRKERERRGKAEARGAPTDPVSTNGDDALKEQQPTVAVRVSPRPTLTEKSETFPVRETTVRTEETTTSPMKATTAMKAIMMDGPKARP